MKRLLFASTLLIFSTYTFSRSIYFSYDAYGNQTLRSPLRIIIDQPIKNPGVTPILNSNNAVRNYTSDITATPNPTTGIFSLSVPQFEPSICFVAGIYNSSGNLVKEYKISSSVNQIDISAFQAGYYFVSVLVDKEGILEYSETLKIIKI